MKFVYATDLHGDESKYAKALDLCLEEKATLLHLGADLLPKGYHTQKRQKDFLRRTLPAFFRECAEKGVKVIGMFGNDDIWTRKPLFRDRCGPLLDEEPYEHEGFIFSGYPYVPDYPFDWKWACKYDRARRRPEPYNGIPMEATEEGIVPIYDVRDYFASKGTIWSDLKDWPSSDNHIMAFHSPPTRHGLDVCPDGRKVGSASIGKWIRERKPYMVLCGHIHESPWMSGVCVKKIGRTIVVQPGQYTSAATIDPLRVETISAVTIARRPPWRQPQKLRAAVITAELGRAPNVELVEVVDR